MDAHTVGYGLIVLGVAMFILEAVVPGFFIGMPATAVTIYLYRKMAPPTSVPHTRAADTMVGTTGLVTVPVTPDAPRGKVKIQNETWSAVTRGESIPAQEKVRVTAVEGVILVVERATS